MLTYFFERYHATHESYWFRKLLSVFIIYKCAYWLMDFDLLLSKDSIMFRSEHHLKGIRSLAYVLLSSESSVLSAIFLGATFLLALYLLFSNRLQRIAYFILWFLVLNINNQIFAGLTGADFLLQQLLFFSIFLSPLKTTSSEVDRVSHNFGVMAIKIQICAAYFIAGLTKLMDHGWVSGTAITDVLNLHEFSLPSLYNSGQNSFTAILGYFVVAYQLSFPVLIWLKKIKKPLIVLGILQHMFIALVMGLPSFGLIMIIAYSIFYFPFFKAPPENS